jgi:hypothetical protein
MPNPHPNIKLKNTLLSIVVFLKHKAEEKGLKPVITVAKLTDMLRSSGLRITYQQLVDLTKDPTIAPSIKSINKNQIEFNLGDDEEGLAQPEVADVPMEPEEPQEGGEEGDYNPDDFAMPEGEEGAPEDQAAAPAPEEEPQGKPQQSIVTQMAKRAAARAD